MAQSGQDAKFFQRGKIEVCRQNMLFTFLCTDLAPCEQEFRADLLAAETKDKKFVKRKTVLKKIVANITLGNDSW
jgi:AP-2 complex subunit beta-1